MWKEFAYAAEGYIAGQKKVGSSEASLDIYQTESHSNPMARFIVTVVRYEKIMTEKFGDHGVDERGVRAQQIGCESTDWSDLAGCCDHSNQLLGFITFIDWQSDYRLLKEKSSVEFFSGFVRIWLSSFRASKICNSRSAFRIDM